MKIKLIIFLFIILSGKSLSQFYGDTAKGYAGDYINVPVHYIYYGENFTQFNISGSILISNPTMFFPNQLLSIDGMITNSKLTRINDSLYNFELRIGKLTSLTLKDTLTFNLTGELLAGNDTVCYLKFFDLKVNDSLSNIFYDTVYSNTRGPSIRYVRLAHLEAGYPNPVWVSGEITWNYNIDKPSDVKFEVFNIFGFRLIEKKFYSESGFQQFTLWFDNSYAAGLYLLKFSTNSGEDSQLFIILK